MAALVLSTTALPAQISNVLQVEAAKVAGKRSQVVSARLQVQLRPGYHVNSHTPADPYLIPLKFTWTETPAVQPVDIKFPEPKLEKYEFSNKPLSVFTGDFVVEAKFKVLPEAPVGQSMLVGKLRYQACNDKMCLPPRTVDIKVPVVVSN